ncbi:NUDIX domain-containing protein [Patescibacteria group bacterium]|nr:NUDIX domain-containing protein [Patescibacteria group bacterium]
MEKQVRVGVGVIIRKNDQVLLGERKGAHGEGTWAFPGGHLEFGETLVECSLREVAEENGVEISNIHFAEFTEDIFDDSKHYLTIFMLADYISGEPQNLEPHKCNGWKWFHWDVLPENVFLTIQHLSEKGFNPFDQE